MSAVLSLAHASPAPCDGLAFVADAATAAALAEAAPGIQLRDGGLGAAIGTLSQVPAPALVVVDVSDSDDPAAGIAALARLDDGRARILAIGTVNDIRLYHALREAGAAEYLVKPVERPTLDAALSRLRREEPSVRERAAGPHRLFVCGARGGAGATTVAVNVAWALSRRENFRVSLIDLDLAFGTVALGLDLEPSHGLREILENPDRVDTLFVASAAARLGERLSVFAAEEALDCGAIAPPSTAAALARLFETLADASECIVVDVPRALALAQPAVFAQADAVALVAEMTLPAARDAARLAQLVRDSAPGCKIALVANKCAKNKGEIDADTFSRGARLRVDHLLPWDDKAAAAAANAGQPLGQAAASSPLAKALLGTADALVPPTGSAPARPLWRRLTGRG